MFRSTHVLTLALSAGLTQAQDCTLLDLNGCGCVDIQNYILMLQFVQAGGPSAGDFNNDGSTDGVDLAFFVANFHSCATTQTLRTGLPETAPYRTLTVEPNTQLDGSTGYDILVQLPAPDAELVSVTTAHVAQGSLDAFNDTDAAGIAGPAFALSAAQLDAFMPPIDSYLTIGDRTGDTNPSIPLAIDLDLAAYVDDRVIDVPSGWSLDITVVGTPASPGLGSADGNTDNRVLITSLASSLALGSFEIAYVVDGSLFIAPAGATINSNPCPADTFYDGTISPIDFNGWIAAYNDNRAECDQNFDGRCTPTDFNAWIAGFIMGCP